MPVQIDPAQYIVAGGTTAAFAFIVKLVTRYQRSVTSVAFDRIDKLEKDLNSERERCDRLEVEHREMQSQMWTMKYQLGVLQRANEGDNK